ncbi:hypothetical protein LPJ61_005487 [Coemansia biformis]|uniref:YhhN-like protein n=1 Tax=Coemansia biformis TaxID=1286918 RepID=A0A9W8CTR1_9FUNG|nr:hypothetical protein LPJ61_005487 [Coemansia biformis]
MAPSLPGPHRAAIVLACAYMAAIAGGRQNIKYALKPTVTLLTAWPTLKTGPRGIFVGLIFSALGDIFLIIPREDMFIPGLLSFLVAHVLYAVSFKTRMQFSWTAAPLAVFAGTMALKLRPGVAQEDAVVQIGVLVYITAIVAMAYTATLTKDATLIVGTLLFCVSDSILAWAKFIHSYAWSELGVMSTYYAAQVCIAAAHC